MQWAPRLHGHDGARGCFARRLGWERREGGCCPPSLGSSPVFASQELCDFREVALLLWMAHPNCPPGNKGSASLPALSPYLILHHHHHPPILIVPAPPQQPQHPAQLTLPGAGRLGDGEWRCCVISATHSLSLSLCLSAVSGTEAVMRGHGEPGIFRMGFREPQNSLWGFPSGRGPTEPGLPKQCTAAGEVV